jgi:hypothetical protein
MHTSIFVTFKICIFYNGISETTDLFQNNIHVEISLVFALQPSAKSFIFNGECTKPLTYQCTRKITHGGTCMLQSEHGRKDVGIHKCLKGTTSRDGSHDVHMEQ